MSEKALTTYPGGRGKTSTFTGLQLDTLENSRKTFARVIEGYATGEVSESQSRTLAYLLGGLLSYWKVELDLRVQEDIDEIKAQLAQLPVEELRQ